MASRMTAATSTSARIFRSERRASSARRLSVLGAALYVSLLYVSMGAPLAHGERAYVSNEDGHSVSVLDTGRAEVVATIAVGKRPRGLKLSHDDSRLYVAVSGLPKCPPTVPDEECAK